MIVLLVKLVALARGNAVVSKLISTGGLNRNYYINVAALGYEITINHFRPAMCGMSVCGEPINGESGRLPGGLMSRILCQIFIFGNYILW
jgi:hypothetical protein